MTDRFSKLTELFSALDEQGQQSLLDFAEFLVERQPQAASTQQPGQPEQPLQIPRPENETVVAAIKRLSRTYPMLDKRKILNQASALMAQHVMGGREAAEVIDELEVIFERHYETAAVEKHQ